MSHHPYLLTALGYLLVAAVAHGVGEAFHAEKYFDGEDDWPPPWEVIVAFWPVSVTYYAVKWAVLGSVFGIFWVLERISHGVKRGVQRVTGKDGKKRLLPKAEVVRKKAA